MSAVAVVRPKTVLVVCTLDTKGDLATFTKAAVRRAGAAALLLDVGTLAAPSVQPDVTREEVAACHPEGAGAVLSSTADRTQCMGGMSSALEAWVMQNTHRFGAILGLGGSCGTAIITAAMRALPIGFPKVMVSTMAAGDVRPYVGTADILMMNSVADVAGVNAITSKVCANAAAAASGMVLALPPPLVHKPLVVMSMFGVTTPCCDYVRGFLEQDYDVVVFHATGSGGRAMERLISEGIAAGVLDLTTTEIADHLVGGILSAGPERLDAAAKAGLPAVISLGALDMVNFAARSSVPDKFSGRLLHAHNSEVTLMRTSVEESKRIAAFIAGKLNQYTAATVLLIPEGGFSTIAAEGMPFHDAAADIALISELERLVTNSNVQVQRVSCAINDVEFSKVALDALLKLMKASSPLPAAEPPSKRQRVPTVQLPAAAEGPRDRVLHRLRKQVQGGKPIIGAGAGSGISAKFEEAGGADLIICYNSGRFRMAGHGSLAGLMPFKDANGIMLEMGEEILPVVKETPVLAGVCATDPFRRMDRLLQAVINLGYSGVQNFPTVGLIDGTFRQNLEETGMSYEKEVEMIAAAHRLGLFTSPYVFNAKDARRMTEVGADMVVAHMGLTTSGSIGASTAKTLEQCVPLIQEIVDAAREVNPNVLVMSHGGPIAMPADAQYIQDRVTGLDGFYGASSMERLPCEEAITAQMRNFKAMKLQAL